MVVNIPAWTLDAEATLHLSISAEPSARREIRDSVVSTDAKFSEQVAELRAWTSARGFRVAGEPEVNRYDPPWTLWFLRRNEVWMTLTDQA